MTLIITELSAAGICMAADSAITWRRNGKIINIDQIGWPKLLRVPSIHAGLAYWGEIGAITVTPFNEFLAAVIAEEGKYTDLATFADHVAAALNKAARGAPLGNDAAVGVHIGGFAPWEDGSVLPFFYHVHNGHGNYELTEEFTRGGDVAVLTEVVARWKGERRKLFEKHQDFPSRNHSLLENTLTLTRREGYKTRNGSFLEYAVMWSKLEEAFAYLNSIESFSIPRDPNSLASRKVFLATMLESVINLYKVSNRSRVVGGTVTSLAISPTDYL